MIKKSLKSNLKIKGFISAVFVVLLALALCLSAAACGGKDENTALVEKIQYGMVEIETTAQSGGAKTYGSGFIVSATAATDTEQASCVIITNYHVIEDLFATIVSVRFFGEEDFTTARIKGFNQEFDMAVIIADRLPSKYHVFSFGSDPALGDGIISLGFVSHRLAAYDGIVSVKDKWLEEDNFNWSYVFETTAAAPFGTSGGPCIDKNGKVVGMTCYNYTLDGLLGGVSYKTHASIIKALYTRIMDSKAVLSDPALSLYVYEDRITITLFHENGVFDIYLSPTGTLKIKNSVNADFPDDAAIITVNNKKVGFSGLIAEIILTGQDTQLVTNTITVELID